MSTGHWTEDLFLRHPEAFLAIHEQAWERGEEQARDLKAVLDRYGVPPAGRILDAPCGIGRHATRLAGMGYRVVGVDLAPAYVNRASRLAAQSQVGERATYLVGDLRRLSEAAPSTEAPFDAALNLWTSLGYYGEETDRLILQEYAKVVRPGGIFALYVVNRDHVVRHSDPPNYEVYGDFVVISASRLDLEASWMRNTWRFFRRQGNDLEHVVTVPVEHRIYSLHELARLLEASGWHPAGAFGGFKMDPPSVESRNLLIVARR